MPTTSFNSQNNNMGEIRDLKLVASKLNKKSDALQAALKKINDKLNELNLGIEVWIAIDDDYDLGYCKVLDKWTLAVRETPIVEDEDGNPVLDDRGHKQRRCELPTSLLSASRTIRIAAVDAISRLIDEIKETAENAVAEIEKAEKLAEEL